MAITYQPTGYGQHIEGLAEAAAGAKARREQEQKQFQLQLRQLDQQLDLERFARQKGWETEKMELASRLDFERSERKRLAELDEMDARIKSISTAVADGKIDMDEAEKEQLKVKLKTAMTAWQMGDRELATRLYQEAVPTREESKYGFGAMGQEEQAPTEAQEPPMKILGSSQVGGDVKYQIQVPMGEYTDVINVDPTDQLVVRDQTGNQAVVSMQEYQDQYQEQGWVVDSLSPQVAQKVQTRKSKIMPQTPVEKGREAIRSGARGVPGFLGSVGGKIVSAFERGAPPTQTPFAGPPSIPHKKISETAYTALPKIRKAFKDHFNYYFVEYGKTKFLGRPSDKDLDRWLLASEEELAKDKKFTKLPKAMKEWLVWQRSQRGRPAKFRSGD